MATKRLRIFAGPNGSGKSSVYKNFVKSGDINLGIFVNADEIENQLFISSMLDFSYYGLSLNIDDFCDKFKSSKFYTLCNGSDIVCSIANICNRLIITNRNLINSYFTAFVADYIRVEMLDVVNVFTIETVMSHPSKIEYIKLAKSKGYRVYLYFVSTESEEINISRVQQRVTEGGHNVPIEKIRSRYIKSLDNLFDAVKESDRAYIFDNSELNNPKWYVEYDGDEIHIKLDKVPLWIETFFLKR